MLLKDGLMATTKFVAESNEYNTSVSTSGAHFACGVLLANPTQKNMDDMHDKHATPPPCSATSTQNK